MGVLILILYLFSLCPIILTIPFPGWHFSVIEKNESGCSDQVPAVTHITFVAMNVLFSGGKDSCYNMMKCIATGHQIVALANLQPSQAGKDQQRVCWLVMHGTVMPVKLILGTCQILLGDHLPLYSYQLPGQSQIYHCPTTELYSFYCLSRK